MSSTRMKTMLGFAAGVGEAAACNVTSGANARIGRSTSEVFILRS
jgi:hypothetical protein